MLVSRQNATTVIDPVRTRPAIRAIESTFAAGLLCPDVQAVFRPLLPGADTMGEINLATRTAALGPVGADVATATFYNFSPAFVASVIPAVWRKAGPEEVLARQQAAFGPALAAALAAVGPAEVGQLAELVRTAAVAAAANVEGRPLFAGHVSLPWPREDHLVIWHATKLLREHRGDGHVGGLVFEGLRGIDALVLHTAHKNWPAQALRLSRHWDEKSWESAIADLRARGWLTADETPTLTAEGRERRQRIEDRTDSLAALAYEPIGPAGLERIIELGGKVRAALTAAGLGFGSSARRPSAT